MRFLSIVGGNCEINNDNYILLSLEECLKNVPCDEVDSVDRNNQIYEDEPHDMFTDKVVSVDTFVVDSEYLSDIICSILKQLNNCEHCDNSLKNSEFPVYVKQIIYFCMKLLKTKSHRRNVLQVLLQHFESWDKNITWLECLEHKDNIFDIIVCVIAKKVLIYWCDRKNVLIRIEKENVVFNEDNYIQDIINLKQIREQHEKERRERKRVLIDYRKSVVKKSKLNEN